MEFCRDLPRRRDGFIIQQYIEGRDETIYSFHGYFDERSNCLGSFVGCKIRTYPMHTGGSTYIRTLHNERLSRLSVKILRQMKFCGIVKIDFKQDPNTGEFHVLEINSRYNLWQLLGAYAGMNLAALAHQHQRSEPYRPAGEYTDDFRLLYLKQDLRSFVKGYWKSGEWTLVSYLRSLKGRKCFRVWDSADPVPFLASVIAFCSRNTARMVRGIFNRPLDDPHPVVHVLENEQNHEEVKAIGLAQPTRIEQ
jgi:predicted ATP-grasp superfamily ATP-dependent carboligase